MGSLGLTTSQPLDAEKFNQFMNALLQAKAKDLYRSKGVLQFTNEGDTKFVFQGVHEQIQFTSAKAKWTPDEPRISKIVFIGRDLDRDALEAGFRALRGAGGRVGGVKGGRILVLSILVLSSHRRSGRRAERARSRSDASDT